MFNWAVGEEILPRSPLAKLKLPRGENRQSALTADQVRAGAKVPFTPPPATAIAPVSNANPTMPDGLKWRALSFEPTVTRSGMLKALAYASIFLLVALYPFGAYVRLNTTQIGRVVRCLVGHHDDV